VSDPGAVIAARLAQLWLTSRPTILERLDLVRSAHSELVADPGNADARRAGREAAHKLSGVLGVFGLPQGTEIAASIEDRLRKEQPLSADELAWLDEQISALDAVIASRPAG
jgi:HPt (histidine-containing phosphotransfer) domain-containing protein